LVLQPIERGARPGIATMIANQATYAVRTFWRDTASAFFTVGFPVMLLLLLPVVFGEDELAGRGGVPLTQFLAPVLAVFGAATAAYADFSERVARARDQGILKRIHGTPLPVWAFMAGRTTSAVVVAFVSLTLTMTVGILVWDVELVPEALPGLITSVVVGIACFSALGLALATIAPNARAVPAIANATLLPLAFFSDIFLIGDLPPWMDTVGWIFPLKHFANAVADAVNPTVPGAGFFPDHLAVMALWGVAGALVALKFWTWEPRPA
jgi:ABC-2 type transport system permease protein